MNLSNIPTVLNGMLALVEDHVGLLQLECQYEFEEGRRRLFSLGFVALCGLNVLFCLQALLVYGLWRWGGSFVGITFGLGGLWAGAGGYAYYRFANRKPSTGKPFAGTREEARKSMQWMKSLLS